MLNKQKYLDKVDELIALGRSFTNGGGQLHPLFGSEATREFRSSSETFIVSLYGEKSPFHRNFLEVMRTHYLSDYLEVIGILLGIRKHIEQGWMDNVRNQLSAEIFNDYLEMANYLNQEGFYVAAAVIAGTTLEERVRQLCILHSVPTESPDSRTSVMKPINADALNVSVAPHYADSTNDARLFRKNYGLRNEAAHGQWNNDSPAKKTIRIDQVNIMIQEVGLFIRNNPI